MKNHRLSLGFGEWTITLAAMQRFHLSMTRRFPHDPPAPYRCQRPPGTFQRESARLPYPAAVGPLRRPVEGAAAGRPRRLPGRWPVAAGARDRRLDPCRVHAAAAARAVDA